MSTTKQFMGWISQFSSALKTPQYLGTIIILSLFSCNSGPLPDTRPVDEQSFIRNVKVARDQAESLPLTDPDRTVVIDQALKQLKQYMADTLNLQFKDWDARVLDNKKTDPNDEDFKLAFGISIDDFNLEETSRFKSIVFRESLSNLKPELRDRARQLKVGEHIKITGSFVTRDKKLDVDPYNEKEYRTSKNIFSNPEFRVDITDIVLVKN